MKNRLICQRCHRLHPLNSTGYCARCAEDLRADEKPRRIAEEPLARDDIPVLVADERELIAGLYEAGKRMVEFEDRRPIETKK